MEDCNEQQFHGLPISLEQQCAATTLTDFVDATSRIGRPVWQALDYRLADHGGAEGTKMDQIRKDPDRDPKSQAFRKGIRALFDPFLVGLTTYPHRLKATHTRHWRSTHLPINRSTIYDNTLEPS